jgi:hypothetical protein
MHPQCEDDQHPAAVRSASGPGTRRSGHGKGFRLPESRHRASDISPGSRHPSRTRRRLGPYLRMYVVHPNVNPLRRVQAPRRASNCPGSPSTARSRPVRVGSSSTSATIRATRCGSPARSTPLRQGHPYRPDLRVARRSRTPAEARRGRLAQLSHHARSGNCRDVFPRLGEPRTRLVRSGAPGDRAAQHPSSTRKHPRDAQVSLLRHCRTGGLGYCDSRSRLIDEGFNDDRRHPDTLHVEHVGSMR